MAYAVTIRIPDRPVAHKDIVFSVKRSGKKYGRLKVSKGAVVWLPGNKQHGFRLNWRQIDRLFQDLGKKGSFPV